MEGGRLFPVRAKHFQISADQSGAGGRIAFDQTIGTVYHPWVAAGKPVMITGVRPVPPAVTARVSAPIIGLLR